MQRVRARPQERSNAMDHALKCIICNAPMAFFLSRYFGIYGLDGVDYWKCQACGFVISKTHLELSEPDWMRLNTEYHRSYQGLDFNPDDERWISRLHAQADVISDLARIGILDSRTKWLDFACGDGKLSSFLKSKHGLTLLKYDRYMPAQPGFLSDRDMVFERFDFVITTSVFEHLTKREDFDYIGSLVSEEGIMGLHTLVCESIPCDPSWFYFVPVHCAFHTNKSMSILFSQWGYGVSIYNVESRMWLWFKSRCKETQAIIEKANERLTGPKYIYKKGFVDYWK
jgi:hypothetical protein